MAVRAINGPKWTFGVENADSCFCRQLRTFNSYHMAILAKVRVVTNTTVNWRITSSVAYETDFLGFRANFELLYIQQH